VAGDNAIKVFKTFTFNDDVEDFETLKQILRTDKTSYRIFSLFFIRAQSRLMLWRRLLKE